MPKKMTSLIIIIIFCAIIFSGYLHEQDIDDSAYVIALGIDTGSDENSIKLTIQVSIPSENGSSSSSSSSEESSSSSSEKGSSDTINKTIECTSIDSGLDSANNIISKKINLSHCKFIVFSEEIASRGISEYIYTLENNIELRSNCNILVSKTEAKEFLENSNPVLENSTSKYYEIITANSKYSGYTVSATLNTVYSSIYDTFGEACTMLGNVEENSDEENSSEEKSSEEKSAILRGMAVFKDDKLAGTLNEEETVSHLLVTNELNESLITIPSPFSENKYIDFHISILSPTRNSVSIQEPTPNVKTSVYLVATILSNTPNFDSSSQEDVNKIEQALSDYIKDGIIEYYEKTSKEFKADIAKLGRHAVYNFPTINDWKSYDWLNKYENATFDVNVNVDVESSYFIS